MLAPTVFGHFHYTMWALVSRDTASGAESLSLAHSSHQWWQEIAPLQNEAVSIIRQHISALSIHAWADSHSR